MNDTKKKVNMQRSTDTSKRQKNISTDTSDISQYIGAGASAGMLYA